jgi:hypothetical protein
MYLRLIALVTGLCSLYLAVGPLLGGLPSMRPFWINLLLWASTVFLIAAALLRLERRTHLLGLLGSGLVIFAYAYSWIVYALARMGYLHLHTRLITGRENWFDRWRLLLDRPISNLLLVVSLVCFVLELHRWRAFRHEATHPGGPANGTIC